MPQDQKPNELVELLHACEAEKSETTMTIRGNLEEWEKHSNFQYERSKAQNKLLEKLVERQIEDDRIRWVTRAIAWFTTKLGAAVALGIFAAVTYATTEIAKAYFVESPEEKARQELLDKMLQEKFGKDATEEARP